jgi:hypothetical protein
MQCQEVTGFCHFLNCYLEYRESDILEMNRVWNEVVLEGVAFPQEETLNDVSGVEFFAGQSYCGVAESEDGHFENICPYYIELV